MDVFIRCLSERSLCLCKSNSVRAKYYVSYCLLHFCRRNPLLGHGLVLCVSSSEPWSRTTVRDFVATSQSCMRSVFSFDILSIVFHSPRTAIKLTKPSCWTDCFSHSLHSSFCITSHSSLNHSAIFDLNYSRKQTTASNKSINLPRDLSPS